MVSPRRDILPRPVSDIYCVVEANRPTVLQGEGIVATQLDNRYSIESRWMIEETPELRVQILTLGPDEEVPWHHHTVVSDTFTCLEGVVVIETETSEPDFELQLAETCAVPPGTAHRVTGKDGRRCRFLIVQGPGRYDYVTEEGQGHA